MRYEPSFCISEDGVLHSQSLENLKSYNLNEKPCLKIEFENNEFAVCTFEILLPASLISAHDIGNAGILRRLINCNYITELYINNIYVLETHTAHLSQQ